jgi:hypothetical protein
MLISINVIDIELNDRRVHLIGFRETDRSAMQPFQVRAEVQVVTLDVERSRFADPMPLRRQRLSIRLPVVSIEILHRAA